MSDRVPVLIASWLGQRHVDRIAAAEPERIEVMYAPDLLPPPRYIADHHAPRRPLDEPAQRRWAAMVQRAEVSFEFDWDKPAEMVKRAPRLKWVQSTSSGIGPQLVRLGVAGSPLLVTNAAGIHAQPLAEFVLMAALYFAREMPRLIRWKQQHHWERFCGRQLADSRMLLIGLGKVGTRVAELCSAIGMEVIGHRRSVKAALPAGVSRMITGPEIDDALPIVDFLVLAAPDTPETTKMIDRRRLALLPRGAVLINIGRGSLVDEEALIESLREGHLGGAGLDVFAKEPLPAGSPLWDMDNVIVSPHSASTVEQENDRLVELFIENLHRYLDGRPLVNEFDHGRLY